MNLEILIILLVRISSIHTSCNINTKLCFHILSIYECLKFVKRVIRMAKFQLFKILLMKYLSSIHIHLAYRVYFTTVQATTFYVCIREPFPLNHSKCLCFHVVAAKHVPNSKIVADDKRTPLSRSVVSLPPVKIWRINQMIELTTFGNFTSNNSYYT